MSNKWNFAFVLSTVAILTAVEAQDELPATGPLRGEQVKSAPVTRKTQGKNVASTTEVSFNPGYQYVETKPIQDVGAEPIQNTRTEPFQDTGTESTQEPGTVALPETTRKKQNASSLNKIVSEEFDLQIQQQLAEIKFLRERLENLEQRIQKRQSNRSQIISRRVQELKRNPAQIPQPFYGTQEIATEESALTPPRYNAALRRNYYSIREDKKPISIPASKPAKPKLREVKAGDTLAIYIPGILGEQGAAPPTWSDPSGKFPPVIGFPVPVREDGTISLPLIGATNVGGKTLADVELILTETYRARKILKDQPIVMVAFVNGQRTSSSNFRAR